MRVAVIVFSDDTKAHIRSMLSVCAELHTETELLFVGAELGSAGVCCLPAGISGVFQYSASYLSDIWDLSAHISLLYSAAVDRDWDIILFSSGQNGNRVAPLLSEVLGSACLLDALSLRFEGDKLLCTKYVYSMNMTAKYAVNSFPAVLTIAAAAKGAPVAQDRQYVIQPLSCPDLPSSGQAEVTVYESESTEGLSSAARVIVAGRGVKNREGFEHIKELAQCLDCAVGSSRPLIQEAIAPQATLIGASGTLLTAEKCIVLGASGMAAFAVGTDGCRKIFAVNNDPGAAIFSRCDYGVVDDCSDIVEEMLRLCKE